jgi:hypothetical protein
MKRTESKRDGPALRLLAYREAWLSAVTTEDVRAIGIALVERATAGDFTAARLVLDRLLGTTPVGEWDSRVVVEERTRLDEILGLT